MPSTTVLGRAEGATKPCGVADAVEDLLLCISCLEETRNRCNSDRCAGLVPLCASCQKQGRRCPHCNKACLETLAALGSQPADDWPGAPQDRPQESGSSDEDERRPMKAGGAEGDRKVAKEGKDPKQGKDRKGKKKDRGAGPAASRPAKRPSIAYKAMGVGPSLQSRLCAEAVKVVGLALATVVIISGALFVVQPETFWAVLAANIPESLRAALGDAGWLPAAEAPGGALDLVVTQGFVDSADSKGCPSHTTHVMGKTACQEISTSRRSRFLQEPEWEGGGPEGCYRKGLSVFYNSHGSSDTVDDTSVRFLCEIGVVYGELGADECPLGSFPIRSEQVCQSSAISLGRAYEGKTNVKFLPRFCYEEGETVSFNVARQHVAASRLNAHHAEDTSVQSGKPICSLAASEAEVDADSGAP